MTPWQPVNDSEPDDVYDYFHVPTAPPREALSELINDYARLNYLGIPEWNNFNFEMFSESDGRTPEDWNERESPIWLAQYDVWARTRKLKDLYIECGWNVIAVVPQPTFRQN